MKIEVWKSYRITASQDYPRRVPKENFPRKLYNKSFIDQACSVKMAAYWPAFSFFGVVVDLDSISVHKHTQKN